MEPTGALSGYRIVELCSGLCGPYATMRMGDAGADVIKIEPPEGDVARRFATVADGVDAPAFLAVNRNKRSLAADLTTAAGLALVRRLVESADVLVEDLGPGEAERLGLVAGLDRLVHCSITPFGQRGPWAGYPGSELVVQAASETPLSLGRPGEPPLRLGADVAALNTAVFASQAVTAALFGRLRTGQGQKVAVSQLGSLLHMRGILWAAQSDPDEWSGFHLDGYIRRVDDGYRTADGRIYFALRRATSEDYDNLMITLGLVDYLVDPRFGNYGRDAAPLGRRAQESVEVWEEGFADFTSGELVDLLLAAGGDAVPMMDHAAIVAHPQVEALGLLIDVERSDGTTYRDLVPVCRMSDTPQSIRRGAPRLGEHTTEILAELDHLN